MHRTLVIGLAGRGRGWAKRLQRHPDFALVGLCDLNQDLLRECADELALPAAQCGADYQPMLASGDVDCVVCAAATTAHYVITRDVLAAGLPCLTEKPFTLSLAEARDLVALADAQGVALEVVQNYRFEPHCQFIAEAVADQRLGRLSAVTGQFHRRRPSRPSDVKIAYPMMFIQGIHHLDWLLAVLPAPVTAVKSQHHTPPWSDWPSPSVTQILLQCEDGVVVNYAGSYEARGEISTYAGLWRFEFERGDLVLDNDTNVWQVKAEAGTRECVFSNAQSGRSGDDWLLDTWHIAIADGIEPPTSGRRNLRTLELLFEACGMG